MADRDAKVRLNLAASGFLSSLEQLQRETKTFTKTVEGIGEAAEKSGKKSSSLFGVMKAGASGARSELTQLGGQLKNVLSQALTLGGALSIGAAVHEAQAATKSYKDLAFAIRRGSDSSMSWQQVQGDVEASAARWKRSNSEIADSYAGIYQETGNLQFSKAAIDAVGMAATATGKKTELWTNIAGTLGEKFGITANGINDAMALVVDRTNQGGISAEELDSGLARVGASAQLLGIKGKAALELVLGGLNMADQAIGPPRQKIMALGNLLEGLANPEKAKEIQKTLGVSMLDPKGDVKAGALDRIIAKTRGKQSELAKVFSGGELKFIASLGQEFAKSFDQTKGDVKTRTTTALDALHHALEAAGKSAYDEAALKKEATDRLSDSDRNLQAAQNEFIKAFERPEMVHAIDQAAAAAPKLARVLGDLVEWGSKHPLGAAAAVAGGVAAKGALTAVITKVSDSAMDSAGKLLGKSMESSWSAGGKLAGASFVIAAGAAGYEIGKLLADYLLDRDKAKAEAADNAASDAEAMALHGTGSTEKRKEAASNLRAKIAEAEKDGPGMFTETVGAWGAKFSGNPDLDPRVKHQKRLANMRAQLAALEAGTGTGKPAGLADAAAPTPALAGGGGGSADSRRIANEVVNGSSESKRVTITNEAAFAAAVARQLGSTTLRVSVVGGGGGANGLPPAPGNGSGSTPR
jgi:hypothetical protein